MLKASLIAVLKELLKNSSRKYCVEPFQGDKNCVNFLNNYTLTSFFFCFNRHTA